MCLHEAWLTWHFPLTFSHSPPLRGQETTTSLDLIPAQVVQSEKMGKSRNGSTGEQMQLEITKGNIKLFEKKVKKEIKLKYLYKDYAFHLGTYVQMITIT